MNSAIKKPASVVPRPTLAARALPLATAAVAGALLMGLAAAAVPAPEHRIMVSRAGPGATSMTTTTNLGADPRAAHDAQFGDDALSTADGATVTIRVESRTGAGVWEPVAADVRYRAGE